jgi:hypothetical protein
MAKGLQIGQLPQNESLTGNELIPFQQGSSNGSMSTAALKKYIGTGGGSTDYMNYITEYNVSVQHPTSGIGGSNKYSLEGAIAQVPQELRNIGLKVSFINSDGKVETWEFQGETFTEVGRWLNKTVFAMVENDIEITDYNLLFDTYENKVWLNGAIVHDSILQRNCTSIVPLDRNNDIYTNTSGNADVVFFDKDGKYISTLNFYNNKPVLKENFPENAELVAFTYYRDSVITDKFFASAKNNYNLKLCQSTILKKKGTRPVVNINLSDSEEEIFLKLASAYITQDCDVYFETGEYTFIKIFDLMNTKYDFRTAVELPIGGNCRYFFNKSTLISKCDSTSEIVCSNQSLFGAQRIGFNSNYELHDGRLIQYDNIYAIHDEGSGEDSYYKHVYDNLIVEYIKGEHTQYLSKPLGGGGNLHADIIIKNCIFKNGNENVSDVSWHFPNNANYKFTITGNRFSYRFSLDSVVEKCNILFTNNSHKENNVFANATVMQFNNVKE